MGEEAMQLSVPDAQATGEGAEGAAQPSLEQLVTENAVLKEKEKHSTEQGVRVAEDLKSLKAELAKLREGSLTNQQHQGQQQEGFPSRDQYVKYWTEQGEKTEKEAGAEYEREKVQWQRDQIRDQAVIALTKKLQFESEERERGLSTLNPKAKEAEEFWAEVPAMSALPISDQIEQMDKIRAKAGIAPRVTKDLSEMKGSIGSSVGGAAKTVVTATSEQDSLARKYGFPSYAAQVEMNKCNTPADFKAWDLKWKKKK